MILKFFTWFQQVTFLPSPLTLPTVHVHTQLTSLLWTRTQSPRFKSPSTSGVTRTGVWLVDMFTFSFNRKKGGVKRFFGVSMDSTVLLWRHSCWSTGLLLLCYCHVASRRQICEMVPVPTLVFNVCWFMIFVSVFCDGSRARYTVLCWLVLICGLCGSLCKVCSWWTRLQRLCDAL